MKKLLFVLAFTFIGGQAFSQIYIVTIASSSVGGCTSGEEVTLTKVELTGQRSNEFQGDLSSAIKRCQ